MPYPQDRVAILSASYGHSASYARQLTDALSVDGMQALIENGTLKATDLIINSDNGISILSASFARELVDNPERLEDIRRIVANPEPLVIPNDDEKHSNVNQCLMM